MSRPELSIDVSRHSRGADLTVRGEIDMDTAPEVAGRLREQLQDAPGTGTVVLDLRSVSFLDSTGIGMLVRARREAATHETELVLVAGETGAVATMLRITGLLNAFHVYSTPAAVPVG